jgi:hypothetical protein
VHDATDIGPGLVDDAVHGHDLGVLRAQFALQYLAIRADGGQLGGRQVTNHSGGGEQKAVLGQPGAEVAVP